MNLSRRMRTPKYLQSSASSGVTYKTDVIHKYDKIWWSNFDRFYFNKVIKWFSRELLLRLESDPKDVKGPQEVWKIFSIQQVFGIQSLDIIKFNPLTNKQISFIRLIGPTKSWWNCQSKTNKRFSIDFRNHFGNLNSSEYSDENIYSDGELPSPGEFARLLFKDFDFYKRDLVLSCFFTLFTLKVLFRIVYA